MIKVSKINDLSIKPIKFEKSSVPIKGYDIVGDNLYPNIFLIAMKGSGKTTVLYNSLRKLIDKNTKVYFFVSTFYNDRTYEVIRDYLDSKEIKYEAFTEIGQSLYALKKSLEKEAEDEKRKSNTIKDNESQLIDIWNTPDDVVVKNVLDSSENVKVKFKKPAKRTPNNFIVFDDMSEDLKMPIVSVIIKQNRHYKCMTWISSQGALDITPGTRENINIYLLFQNIPKDKLERFYESSPLWVPYEMFVNIYLYATADKHDFLYVNRDTKEFRKNYNTKIDINTQ